MRKPALLVALTLIALPVVLGQEAGGPFRKVGTVAHPPINEMSGLARSRTYEDVWWVHNDSGDSARIFALDGEGKVIIPPYLRDRYTEGPAVEGKEEWPGVEVLLSANQDWEDIALGDGRLYIADVGNNGNARRDLGVYVLNEPNPRAVQKSRVLKHLPVRYPDQGAFPGREWHYDCEAVFFSEGRLYFLTKHRVTGEVDQGKRGTKLYRLDTEHTDRVNVLTYVEGREDLALPTAADLSPDGKRLAVLTALALWVFEKPAGGDLWLSGKARRVMLPREETRQAEGVTWDDDTLVRLSNEQGDLFVVALSTLEPVR